MTEKKQSGLSMIEDGAGEGVTPSSLSIGQAHDKYSQYNLGVAARMVHDAHFVPESFKFIRQSLGMRALDLAELLGVSSQTISNWECGRNPIGRTMWFTLIKLLEERTESFGPCDRLLMRIEP